MIYSLLIYGLFLVRLQSIMHGFFNTILRKKLLHYLLEDFQQMPVPVYKCRHLFTVDYKLKILGNCKHYSQFILS